MMLTRAGIVSLSLLTLVGCNTPRTTERLKDQAIEQHIRGDYTAAQHTINHLYGSWLHGEPAEVDGGPQVGDQINEKHEIVWQLERGSVALEAHKYRQADRHFDRASAALVEARAQRVGDLFKEALANETAGSYRGQRHEDVYAEYYRIMSTLTQANLAARRWRPAPRQAVAEGVALGAPNQDDQARVYEKLPPLNPLDAYDKAINLARGLNNSTLKWTADSNNDSIRMDLRYRDDGFARTLAAAVALSHPQPVESDLQFAVASCEAALKAYADQRRTLGNDERFRLELGKAEQITQAILIRALQRYDPERARQLSSTYPGLVSDHHLGMVLVLNEVGFAARKHILDVRAGNAGAFSWAVSLTEDERRRGYQVRGFHFGPLIYWVRGPAIDRSMFQGAEAPAAAIAMVAADPGTSIGFALPVHAPDQPVKSTALLLRPEGGPVALTVASDIDAAVRATLYDEAPSRITATLARVVAKQIAALGSAKETEKEQGEFAGFLSRLFSTSLATATEVADTRCWTLLPNRIEAALIDLPPGSQPLKLQLSDGRIADLGEVLVEPGQLTIIRHRSLPARQASE